MSDRKPRRESPALNAGSMADIAFLLLIFFLVTTTIAEDAGVLVKLPEWVADEENKILTSAVFTVIVNADDLLLVEDAETTTARLPELLRLYVSAPERTPKQAVVSLVHDRSTSYVRYLEIYDALLAGYHELWEESAQRNFGAAYDGLGDEQKKSIRTEIPMIISEAEPNDARG